MKNIIIIILLLTVHISYGQTGKKEYMEALNSYETGQYEKSLQQLNKVELLLGETNAVIEQLSVKCYFHLNKFTESNKALIEFYKYPSSDGLSEEMIFYKKQILLTNLSEPLNELKRQQLEIDDLFNSRLEYVNQQIGFIELEKIQNEYASLVFNNGNQFLILNPDSTFLLFEPNEFKEQSNRVISTHVLKFINGFNNSLNYYLKTTINGYTSRMAKNTLYKETSGIDIFYSAPNLPYVATQYDKLNPGKYDGMTFYDDLYQWDSGKTPTIIVRHGKWSKSANNSAIHLMSTKIAKIFPTEKSKLKYIDRRHKGYLCAKSSPSWPVQKVVDGNVRIGYSFKVDAYATTNVEKVWVAYLKEASFEKELILSNMNSIEVLSQNQIFHDQNLSEIINYTNKFMSESNNNNLVEYQIGIKNFLNTTLFNY